MKDRSVSELLKNHHFRLLWSAQMLSQFSIQIITFFILTQIFESTKSTIAVSMMWVAGALPALIFGPFTGAIVDNVSRRKLLMTSAALQAVVVTSLVFFSTRYYFLYVVVFLYWFLDQVYYPSQQSTVPELVKNNLLPLANGFFLLTQQASIVVGFGLGGLLLSKVGPTPTVLLSVINLLIAAFLVSRLPDDNPKAGIEKGVAHFFEDLLEGYRYVREHPKILKMLGAVICSQILITIISTSIPAYSRDILGINLNDASVGLVVPAALGALVTTLLLTRILRRISKNTLIQFGWILGIVCVFILGSLSLLPVDIRLPIALLNAVVLGIAVTSVIVPSQSIIQELTPERLLGRVYGQLGFLLILSTTLPLIASAAIADALGLPTLLYIICGILLVGFFVGRAKHLFNKTKT